jgi:hypothetical protein
MKAPTFEICLQGKGKLQQLQYRIYQHFTGSKSLALKNKLFNFHKQIYIKYRVYEKLQKNFFFKNPFAIHQ